METKFERIGDFKVRITQGSNQIVVHQKDLLEFALSFPVESWVGLPITGIETLKDCIQYILIQEGQRKRF